MTEPTASPPPAVRVRFPLWVKLGLLFGGLYGLSVGLYGALDWREVVAAQRADDRAELEELAIIVAAGVDADAHATFATEADRVRPAFAQAAQLLRYAADRSDLVYYATTCTRDDLGRWSYVVDGDRASPYPVGFPIFDGIPERNAAFEGRVLYVPGLVDESGRWDTALAPIRGADGAVVGLVELIADADRGDLVLEGRFRRTFVQFSGGILASLVIAFVFGRYLAGDLGRLVRAAEEVARGRLDVQVQVRSRDEIGLLADRFNRMVEGLREREFIRDTFGRFVNRDVVSQILADRSRLALGGEQRTVTVVMTDLRGFTALGEELGPERMVQLLNAYLARMTTVVEAHEGNVAELLGDGLVILFGAPVRHDDDARRAIACAVAMHHELGRFNAEQGRSLQMGVGIDTGVVIAGNIGDERHMKYGVVGAAINVAARLESFTLGNQVLISEATRLAAGDDVVTDEVLEFRVKGRRGLVRAYPVRSVGPLAMPDELHGLHVDGRWPVRVQRVDGKRVDEVRHPAVARRLEVGALTVESGLAVAERDKIRLELELDGRGYDELYGTVERVQTSGFVVRLSSVPPDAAAAIERHVSEHAADTTGNRMSEPTGSRA